MESITEKITTQFSKDPNIRITIPFTLNKEFWVTGEILVNYKGAELPFKTVLPITYPLTQPHSDNISINFINEDLIGFKHINNDGSVCFHPDKNDDFNRKIKAEIAGLKQWILDYYINDKEDERYTYLHPSIKSNLISTLYFGENPKKFKQGECGVFKYSLFSSQKQFVSNKTSIHFESYFKIGFDKDNLDDWSDDFFQYLHLNQDNVRNGLWCYIEHEPIKNIDKKRILASNWKELELFLSQDFLKLVYSILKERKKNFFFNDYLFVLLGYKIPTDESYETHWQLIKVHKKEVPVKGKKISNGNYIGICAPVEINWGLTKNTSYQRFFGRGKLSDSLTNARILIVGIGALGSSLAEILVRGGAKNLSIDDYDIVETGNLCRANYSLFNLNFPKIDALSKRLLSISPFVNVKVRQLKLNSIPKDILEKELNDRFDFIFDCSTDTEVTYILDSLDFKGKIFSLGLTNNAKHLTCLTGNNTTKETAALYEYFENEPASFYEGTGCGYPTFNANFNDINTLLNLSIKKLNESLNSNSEIHSFVVRNFTAEKEQILITSYISFFQPEKEQQILIPKNIFKKIKTSLLPHFPKEFGGIFVGYKSHQFQTIIVEDILLPEKYKNGKAEFVRHPNSLNKRLELLYKETNGKTEYLGEFHSHPNAPARPSKIDYNTMNKIAKASKVTTNNPILMIGKIDKQKLVESKCFIFADDKLYEYEQQG